MPTTDGAAYGAAFEYATARILRHYWINVLTTPDEAKRLAPAFATFSRFLVQEAVVETPKVSLPAKATASRIIRDWVRQGAVEVADEENERWRLTAGFLASGASEQPDLLGRAGVEKLGLDDLTEYGGVPLHDLRAAELRFIAEHVGAYTFRRQRSGSYRYEDADVTEINWSGRVLDSALRDAIRTRVRRLTIEKAYSKNLAWGLVQLGVIDPVDEDCFTHTSSVFGGMSVNEVPRFSVDPTKWGDDADRAMNALRERIARDTRRANAIRRAFDAIAASPGGLQGFLARYHARVEAEVDARAAAEPKE